MRSGRKMTLFLMMMIISLSFCKTLTADAASVSFSLPVSIELEGDLPVKAEQFQIKLVPEEPDFPMPEDGKDTVSIFGQNSESFSKMCYSHPGIYRYQLYQMRGKSECEYDQRKYQLIVTVTNSTINEMELEISAALYGERNEGKVPDLIFYNEYPVEPETETELESATKPVKTGVDDYSAEYMLIMILSLLLACKMMHNIINRRIRN